MRRHSSAKASRRLSGGNPTTRLPPAAVTSFSCQFLSNLTFQVLFSTVIGIDIGHLLRETAIILKWFADAFIWRIQWCFGPILFITVTLGVGSAGGFPFLATPRRGSSLRVRSKEPQRSEDTDRKTVRLYSCS